MYRQSKPRLAVEPLERRELLAGNVIARVVDGSLYVTGDNAANVVSVESAGVGRVQVRGFADASLASTTINGLAGVASFTSVSGNVIVRLRGGNDLVRLTNMVLPAGAVIDLGNGHDEAVTGRDKLGGDARFGGAASGSLYLAGGLRVTGGIGNDLAYSSDLHVQGLGTTELGDGNDTLFMQRPDGGLQNVDYGGNFTVRPGAGKDVVDAWGLVVSGNLLIDDLSGRLVLAMRSMDINRNFTILTDESPDVIDVGATNVHARFLIDTGGGNDLVRIGAIADRMDVRLGDGDDRLDLIGSHTEVLVVHGDEGNDVFLVRNTRSIDAYFFGEGGSDAYRETAALPNRITRLHKVGIESEQVV